MQESYKMRQAFGKLIHWYGNRIDKKTIKNQLQSGEV